MPPRFGTQQVRQLPDGTAAATPAAAGGKGGRANASSAQHLARQAAAKAAAEAFAGRLAAARDSRAMRQHLPGVDAAQFCSGDSSYRGKVRSA